MIAAFHIQKAMSASQRLHCIPPSLCGRCVLAAVSLGLPWPACCANRSCLDSPQSLASLLTGSNASRVPGGPSLGAVLADNLTHVELTRVARKIEHWIRFGISVHEQILDGQRRVLSFQPAIVFAFVRWASNDFGTTMSRIDIVRAVRRDEAYLTLPFVHPGGTILLKVEGGPKVERVLQMIDAIENAGIDPEAVSPDHWRHIHNRLTVGEAPRAYTPDHHRAFVLRRRAEP